MCGWGLQARAGFLSEGNWRRPRRHGLFVTIIKNKKRRAEPVGWPVSQGREQLVPKDNKPALTPNSKFSKEVFLAKVD